jgi:hypothetical protein
MARDLYDERSIVRAGVENSRDTSRNCGELTENSIENPHRSVWACANRSDVKEKNVDSASQSWEIAEMSLACARESSAVINVLSGIRL